MATRSIGILLMAALVAFLIAVAPSSSAAKPRASLSTRQHDTDLRVVLRLVRVEVRSGKEVPESCGLSNDSDLAILHYVVRNFGNRPYAGHVNLFSLLSPPATAGDDPASGVRFTRSQETAATSRMPDILSRRDLILRLQRKELGASTRSLRFRIKPR